MASRKLLVLDFIKRYLTAWGRSPSYREIGEGAGVSYDTAKRHVRRLARDGLIVRPAGARRGIALPEQVDEALALVTRLGWRIDDATHLLSPPTKTTLTLVAELDHDPEA